MSNKKWLTAILIISVLAIAFFWGGDYQKNLARTAASSPEAQVIHETASPQTSDKPIETDKPVEIVKPTEIDKSTETDRPVAALVEKPEEVSKLPDKASVPQTQDQSTSPAETKKDKYLTDPVPEGKPKPVEWQDVTINKDKELTVTLSVTSKTILDNMDIFNKDKLEVLPADGIIYKAQQVIFNEGESVFDVLLREMKKNKIHMEFSMTPIYNSNYVEGINNLYEFDCGELSGWMYKVNGWFPNYGSSRYLLKDGDIVEWVYTCDLGRDVGGYVAVEGEGK